MKRTLYLMLAATIIIGVVGIVRISSLFKQNLLDGELRSGLTTTGVSEGTVSGPGDRVKNIIPPKTGNGDFLTQLPCFQCHQMQSWEGLGGPGNFPHTLHIAMNLHCLECHKFVAHGEGMGAAEDSCGRCHGG